MTPSVRPSRLLLPALLLLVALGIAGCRTPPTASAPAPEAAPQPVAPPTSTRGEFTLAADKLDTWNAVGQIIVRTDGVTYYGRSQMLDLYTVRYRGQSFLLLTRALVLSDTIRDTTTLVTATTRDGKPIDDSASADLLAVLQRELPAEIVRVRALQAAEKAKAKTKKAKKPKKKKK